ncbi:MAG: hypothetical protein H7061_00955 [Bdellovibrionaceae bacterium]|nr:hypothetical protein [Bdellovibrio sp.]
MILILSFVVTSEAKEKISAFKKELNECFKTDFLKTQSTSLKSVYAELDKRFQLVTTELIARDTEFKENDETRKLKYAEKKLALYRVEDNELLVPINTDLRQKDRLIDTTISQLLIHATMISDYMKTKEVRAGQRFVTVTKADGEITALDISKLGQKKQLFCTRKIDEKGAHDICSCREPK